MYLTLYTGITAPRLRDPVPRVECSSPKQNLFPLFSCRFLLY